MKLLTLCFPTFGKDNELHLSSRGQVVLAPDEFHRRLLELGWEVDVVALGLETRRPLFRSQLPLKRYRDVRLDDYDVFWHMFRDPTQPEVLAMLDALSPDYGGKPVINRADRLANHCKDAYLPVFERRGVGASIVDVQARDHAWINVGSEHVNADRTLVNSNACNNNRGDYPQRGSGRVVTRYLDNAREGRRSIVRFGYAFGQGFAGFQFYCPDSVLCFKTGAAKLWEPYAVPEHLRPPIAKALQSSGCDVCHVEAIPFGDRIYVIDVNPYPTADGKTLTSITRIACDALVAFCGAAVR